MKAMKRVRGRKRKKERVREKVSLRVGERKF